MLVSAMILYQYYSGLPLHMERSMLILKGSLQEKGGKYYAVFRLKNKKKWINLDIPTTRGNKRKAEQALQAVLSDYENRIVGNSEILFVDFLSDWLNDMKDVIKPSTFETYKITVNKKIIPYFEKKEYVLTDIKPRDITEFLKYLKLYGKNNSSGLSYKSVRNIYGILSVAFNFAYKNDMIVKNPILDCSMPTFEKDIKKEVVIYTPDEVQKLLKVAKDSHSHIYLFLLLALFSGARRGELLALTWNDVDYDNKTLSITKSRTGTYKDVTALITTPKTNASNRVIPLTDNVISELRAEQERQQYDKLLLGNAYVDNHNFIIRNKLGKPYTNLSCINRVVYRLMDKAGLKRCTIHGLRHTVASILDSNGIPIQEISILLGHENIKTTENIYIHRSRTIKRDNILLLDKIYDNH